MWYVRRLSAELQAKRMARLCVVRAIEDEMPNGFRRDSLAVRAGRRLCASNAEEMAVERNVIGAELCESRRLFTRETVQESQIFGGGSRFVGGAEAPRSRRFLPPFRPSTLKIFLLFLT